MAAQQADTAPPKPNDYADGKTWLCRPGRQDACAIDHTTTVVAADGKLTQGNVEGRSERADRLLLRLSDGLDRPDAEQRHDRRPGGAERHQAAVRALRVEVQAVRAALSAGHAGRAAPHARARAPTVTLDQGLQYDDVLDAWNYYLKHDNKGRGVVLVAHSQGSFILNRLIRNEIDGKPMQSKLVSAILLGTTLAVPKGKDVGGIVPAHAALPRGVADRLRDHVRVVPIDDAAAGQHAVRASVPDADMEAACTNPAALGGGSGELRAYLDQRPAARSPARRSRSRG